MKGYTFQKNDSDLSHLKISWNKYMNTTGFKQKNQRKDHIERILIEDM